MIFENKFTGMCNEVREMMRSKLGIKSRDLTQAFRKAGRRLPRRIRRRGAVLARFETLARHPKLVHQIDAAEMTHAHRDVMQHLAGIDTADLRRGRLLSIAGTIASYVLVIAACFVAWLWWRGYI